MIPRYLFAAALFSAAAAPLSAQSVKAGIEAWQHADYAAAVAIWRPLAEKGDADAAFNLGQAYRLGRGVPTNIAAATTWFQRAAAKGHVDAETTLGLLLFENGDQAGGLRWLKAAADKGEPRALLVYGTALVNGDGVKRDPVLGYAFVSRAAAQGLAPAKETLAQLDQLLPLEARKKGVAIAAAKAKATPPPSSKPVQPAKPVQIAAAKPVSKPVHAPVPQQAAASGAWRIQLGAFSQRGSAEALYRKVSGSLAGHQAFYIPVGAMTRLQVGPYPSRAAAQGACSALKAQACFPVAAK
ncbi:MAG TPA: SPOR domain-containing protein [Sphingomicrobium sp.]|nr:SPOR domain-containing protein [Sphingomicrobium sp.]